MEARVRNYTSVVPVEESIRLIEQKLVRFGASHIMKEYADGGRIAALSFTIMVDKQTLQRIPVRLPANVEGARLVLNQLAKSPTARRKVPEQAPRTAWKLALDWLDVQLSLVEMKQVDLVQVFLPYVACGGGKSFYEVIKADGYRALPGLPAPKHEAPIEAEEG
jgi:hypothetical protein